MRLTDLAVAYLVVGVGCVWALRSRRDGARTLVDGLLTFSLWPLYVPMMMTAPHSPRAAATPSARAPSARILRERDLLVEALDAARAGLQHPALASLLPTQEQLARVVEHLTRLDAKVQELDEVLAREEFDPARAERKLRDAERGDRGASETAATALETARRLAALRERAAGERDELLGLCARLRMRVTVLRFTDAPRTDAAGEDLGELVGDILGRIEGVGAALEA